MERCKNQNGERPVAFYFAANVPGAKRLPGDSPFTRTKDDSRATRISHVILGRSRRSRQRYTRVFTLPSDSKSRRPARRGRSWNSTVLSFFSSPPSTAAVGRHWSSLNPLLSSPQAIFVMDNRFQTYFSSLLKIIITAPVVFYCNVDIFEISIVLPRSSTSVVRRRRIFSFRPVVFSSVRYTLNGGSRDLATFFTYG